MSTDRFYVRCRSRSPVSYRIRRSLSFDPYIFRRSDSFASYDQHVRRSFTPAREKLSETAHQYYFTPPYEYHVPRLARRDTASDYFYSTYREGSSNPFRVSTHVLDDRPFRSNPKYNIYVPSGWSTPLYKYMNPHFFRTYSYSGDHYFDNHSLTTTLKPILTRAYAPSYLSSYDASYRPSYTTGQIYYYQADSKKWDDYKWKSWYDRGSILGGYKNYYGETGLRHFAGFTPRLSQHYCTAVWDGRSSLKSKPLDPAVRLRVFSKVDDRDRDSFSLTQTSISTLEQFYNDSPSRSWPPIIRHRQFVGRR
uniref:Uncharacterized protein n=1 Tax=Romanomermis culicivorax TaxID=13658 RepID=A0A915L6E4_ROMCU